MVGAVAVEAAPVLVAPDVVVDVALTPVAPDVVVEDPPAVPLLELHAAKSNSDDTTTRLGTRLVRTTERDIGPPEYPLP